MSIQNTSTLTNSDNSKNEFSRENLDGLSG